MQKCILGCTFNKHRGRADGWMMPMRPHDKHKGCATKLLSCAFPSLLEMELHQEKPSSKSWEGAGNFWVISERAIAIAKSRERRMHCERWRPGLPCWHCTVKRGAHLAVHWVACSGVFFFPLGNWGLAGTRTVTAWHQLVFCCNVKHTHTRF